MKNRITWLIITVLILSDASLSAQSLFYDVRDYGAKGDGKTLDTDAVNETIQAASNCGGGTVILPAGTYICGSIRLRSNITLRLEAGATIKGAPNNINAYDLPEELGFEAYQDFGHSHWHNSLIWGVELENIAIVGEGTIHGGGMVGGNPQPGGGDKAIALKLCRNIRINGINIVHGGHFAMLLTGCDNVKISEMLIDTQRDGINLDCCKNCMVTGVLINSDDDGLCLKSSYALGYARPTENVTITNCILTGYTEQTVINGKYGDDKPYYAERGGIKRISRIKFGTESNGGFRNVTISNCVFDKCWGLALEIVDGGIMENIAVNNITMNEIADTPFFLRLGNRARGPEGTPVGKMRNIKISNVIATVRQNEYGSIISGIPGHSIENLTMRDIRIVYPGGMKKQDFPSPEEVPENEKGGPGERMFGKLPSWGFFIRHVKGLELENVSIETRRGDTRPAIILQDVQGLDMENVHPSNGPDKQRAKIIMQNVELLRQAD